MKRENISAPFPIGNNQTALIHRASAPLSLSNHFACQDELADAVKESLAHAHPIQRAQTMASSAAVSARRGSSHLISSNILADTRATYIDDVIARNSLYIKANPDGSISPVVDQLVFPDMKVRRRRGSVPTAVIGCGLLIHSRRVAKPANRVFVPAPLII